MVAKSLVRGLICTLPLTLSAPAFATPDVKADLEATDTKYEIDDDGDYKITVRFKNDEDRTQLVWVLNNTNDIKDMKVREVNSPVMRLKGALDRDIAIKLLKKNGDVKIGAFTIVGNVDDGIVLFTIQLPENASPQDLDDAIGIAASSADDMEKELTGGKDNL